MMRAGASLTENRFFNNCGGKLFAKTGPILLDSNTRLLKRYCRKIYELGYVPICPKLSDSQYLQMENADEKREFQNISRQKLCRCRMLVVCGNEISNSMSAEIGTAEKRNIICTTLEGLAKIKESDEHDGL